MFEYIETDADTQTHPAYYNTQYTHMHVHKYPCNVIQWYKVWCL